MAQSKTQRQGKQKAVSMDGPQVEDVKVWGPVYVCPEIIRDPQVVSDAELKAWALTIMELIKAGILKYSWATMSRIMQTQKVAVKLGTSQQSLGLLHACGRRGLKVFHRKCEEKDAIHGSRVVYYVIRSDLGDQTPLLGWVYGAGTAAARKLLNDGSIRVTDERLRKRIEMAARKLLPREYPEVYREFCSLRGDLEGRRHRVLYADEEEGGGCVIRLAEPLKALMEKHQRKKKKGVK
jgi:hypothetical protein